MQRFVSRRSPSSFDLDFSSLDDVRTERAAIAPVCWSEFATRQEAAVARTPQLARSRIDRRGHLAEETGRSDHKPLFLCVGRVHACCTLPFYTAGH